MKPNPDEERGDSHASHPTRRSIIHAGWSVPLIIAVSPPLYGKQQDDTSPSAVPPRPGSHTDMPAHLDGGHIDINHDDQGHLDVNAHGDQNHVDDNHSDENHLDTWVGTHLDRGHQDDSAHQDMGHVDQNHFDLNHQDTAHTDEAHVDQNHGDAIHLDGVYHADSIVLDPKDQAAYSY